MTSNTHYSQAEFEQYFTDVLVQSAEALLATVDSRLERDDAPVETPAAESAGVVGFVGPDIRGMFSLALSGDDLGQPGPDLYEDWVAELTNQLAGRVKNQLGRVGIGYGVAPPVTLRGKELSIAAGEPRIHLTFSHAGALCSLVAVLEVARALELVEVEAGQEPLGEGELMFL